MATMADNAHLFLDTNVLIYASVREAPEHQVAYQFVEQHLASGTTLYVSRQVLREYLSVLSRTQNYSQPIPRDALLSWLAAWRDRCRVLDDTAPVMDILWQLFSETSFGGKQVHDANIVATLFCHGLDTLVTYNTSDFIRFMPRLKLIDPRKERII